MKTLTPMALRLGLARLWSRYLRWHTTHFRFGVIWCEDLPGKLKFHTIYIVGSQDHPWQAVFACPCGCGDDIYVGVDRGQWKLDVSERRVISLRPSIHRTVGCCSHFFVEYGLVRWC